MVRETVLLYRARAGLEIFYSFSFGFLEREDWGDFSGAGEAVHRVVGQIEERVTLPSCERSRD